MLEPSVLPSLLAGASPVVLEDGVRGDRRTLSRDALIAASRALAAEFRQQGLVPGQRVATVLPNGEAFLRTLLAAWLCRAAVVPLDPAAPPEVLATALRISSPRLVAGAGVAAELVYTEEQLLAHRTGSVDLEPPRSEDLALLQFTADARRAALVRHGGLAASLSGLAARTGLGPADRVVSWLPVHHPAGLLAGVLLALSRDLPLLLIPYSRFAADVSCWLRGLSEFGGTVSAAPTFALGLAARRVTGLRRRGLDLSRWRCAPVAGRTLSARALDAFRQGFAECGLPEDCLQPAYVLPHALVSLSRGTRVAWISRPELRSGRILPMPEGWTEATPVVGRGAALPGLETRLVDAAGEPVGEYRQGRLEVRGACLAGGWFGERPVRPEDWLDTGDTAFRIGDDLYVTGHLVAQEVEEAVTAVPGVRGAALLDAVVVAETLEGDRAARDRMAGAIRRQALRIGGSVERVILTGPGTLPKSASGTVERTMVQRLVDEGRLPADALAGRTAFGRWRDQALRRLAALTRTLQTPVFRVEAPPPASETRTGA